MTRKTLLIAAAILVPFALLTIIVVHDIFFAKSAQPTPKPVVQVQLAQPEVEKKAPEAEKEVAKKATPAKQAVAKKAQAPWREREPTKPLGCFEFKIANGVGKVIAGMPRNATGDPLCLKNIHLLKDMSEEVCISEAFRLESTHVRPTRAIPTGHQFLHAVCLDPKKGLEQRKAYWPPDWKSRVYGAKYANW